MIVTEPLSAVSTVSSRPPLTSTTVAVTEKVPSSVAVNSTLAEPSASVTFSLLSMEKRTRAPATAAPSASVTVALTRVSSPTVSSVEPAVTTIALATGATAPLL